MAPSSYFVSLLAAALLALGTSAEFLCPAPVSGACTSPNMCHYENYYDAVEGKTVEECLSCPSGRSVAWTGLNASPAPECIYSNVKTGAACDPSFILYTHEVEITSAACYDQCGSSTNIAWNGAGNPTGCITDSGSRRRLRR